MTAFANRLTKNFKHLRLWAQKFPCTAFRVYDRDIPEYAVTVDYYNGKIVVCRYFSERFAERDELHFAEVITAVKAFFEVEDTDVFVKERQRKKGLAQYEKVAQETVLHHVSEGQFKFIVNLSDYLDTGLFLDHRISRRWVHENAQGKRVLNLFCYTGAVSVHAAGGGAKSVTSIDMSATYLDWAEDNFRLNNLLRSEHRFIRADVCEWLKRPGSDEKFDLIFLDPPSFSNSKKMQDVFDVQQDHVWMVERCIEMLSTSGVLFFSNNLRTFKLAESLREKYSITDFSRKTIPPDFRNELIHHAWIIGRNM
ncbi:MAG: methyltransferase domain-containing protein [Betaproteobacteria bacterium]|nr:methyltransferase domain-containing protein [Betaproteobacteria bacterium]